MSVNRETGSHGVANDHVAKDIASYFAKALAVLLLSIFWAVSTVLAWLFWGLGTMSSKLAEGLFAGAKGLNEAIRKVRWHEEEHEESTKSDSPSV